MQDNLRIAVIPILFSLILLVVTLILRKQLLCWCPFIVVNNFESIYDAQQFCCFVEHFLYSCKYVQCLNKTLHTCYKHSKNYTSKAYLAANDLHRMRVEYVTHHLLQTGAQMNVDRYICMSLHLLYYAL